MDGLILVAIFPTEKVSSHYHAKEAEGSPLPIDPRRNQRQDVSGPERGSP